MRKMAAFLLTACVAACGGATLDPLEDGGGDGGPIQDGGSTECPSTTPSDNASCSKEGLTCEYGDDPNLYCNTVAQCSGGQWHVQPPYGQCPTPPNPSSCPAAFASVPVGQHCGTLVGTTCEYPEGFCGCSVGSGGPYPEDAAAVATWICEQPESGCPKPRPTLGTSCSPEGLQCDYAPCSLPTGVSVVCKNGAWEEQLFGCAL